MISEKINQIVDIELEDVTLEGELIIPEGATSIVIFSHGSGSSRFSPRNKYVASRLQKHKLGTFLFDLLTEEEDRIYENRFDIDLLTERLVSVTKWLMRNSEFSDFKIGYFGSSTGAASALKAAGILGSKISAVVSRGGRPDLALRELPEVTAAVRLIVGGYDHPVIGMNEVAFNALDNAIRKDLIIVPEATHLFEEPGKLDEVSDLATEWFRENLE